MQLSKTQVDKLGDRLKQDPIQADDLRSLGAFRDSFSPAFEAVLKGIEQTLRVPRVPVSGRGAKSIVAIVAKLRRERTRLSRMQDIAGCRIVVETPADQDRMTADIAALFANSRLIDRRAIPSFGYRAVHVIVTLNDRPVEIQIRTELQHRWAQLSELLADVFGSEIKYGGGPQNVKELLLACSGLVASLESKEPVTSNSFLQQAVEYEIGKKEAAALKACFNDLIRIARDKLDEHSR